MRTSHEQNRRHWDEITFLHLENDFYDVDEFVAGDVTIGQEERDALGGVAGKRLLHLQCHFGLDTLNWARLGAEVVGVDFCGPAVQAARELAERTSLSNGAQFIQSDVLELDEILEPQFDIVFTSVGAISWLDDINRWGQIVARYVSPAGFFYILEDHPVILAFEDDGNGGIKPEHSYFRGSDPIVTQDDPEYTDPNYSPTEAEHSFIWPVSAVMGALEQAGMTVSEFREFPFMRWQMAPCMPIDERENYRMPPGMPDLPLMYSFKARHSAP